MGKPMQKEDPHDLPEETYMKRAYDGFIIDKLAEDNINEITSNLKEGKINSSNKKTILEYLSKIHEKISTVKKNEFAYEGEENTNVNIYIARIEKLAKKISEIK